MGNLLQCTIEVNTSLNPPKTTTHIPGDGESDWLPPPAYKAVDPASTGVSHPSDGLPANLPEGEDNRQDEAALQGCHTPLAVIQPSSSISFSRRLSDSYQNNQAPSSSILIGLKQFIDAVINGRGSEAEASLCSLCKLYTQA